MMKKIFTFLFCLTVCLTFSGCCHQDNGKTILRFSTWGSSSEMKIIMPIISEFERENPDIHIELMHIPQDYFKKLHLMFASNLAPDVIFINNLNLPVYSKYLENLDEYADKSVYFPQSIQSLSVDGELYAIPRDVSVLMLYYNKTLFDKYGIDYPKSGWSLDELITISKNLTHNGVWGIGYDRQLYYALPYIKYYNGGIYNSNGENITLSAQTKKGIEEYKGLAYKYHVAPYPSELGSKTTAQLFLEGKLGMHLSGRWMVPKYRDSANFKWDVVNFPNCSSPCDASGWAITKSCKNKPAAIRFVLYLSKYENISKMASCGLIVPARRDVANSDIFLKGGSENSKVFIYAVENSQTTNVTKDYNKVLDKLNDKVFNNNFFGE